MEAKLESSVARVVFGIARNELVQAHRTGALAVLGGLVLSLVLLSTVVGYHSHRTSLEARESYQEMVHRQWKDQPDRHPHRVSHYGFLVFRPRAPLSYFDIGVDSYAGTSLFLEPHRQNTANFTEARHSTGMIRFGEMSAAAVLQLLLPLLIFFIGASTVSGEREKGTLPLLLCQGVPFGAILAGKILGVLAVVGLWLLPSLAVSAAYLGLATRVTFDGDAVLRSVLLLGVYGLFFLLCATAAVLVSARHRTSRGALTTLVCAWVFLWVALPRGLSTLGEALHPAPSRAEFEAELERDVRRVGDSHNPNDPHFQSLKEGILAEHGVSDEAQLPMNYKGVVMLEAEKATTSVFRRHYRRILEIHERQNAIARWGAFVDPYLAMREISMALAGSDADTFEDFYWQAEEYRLSLVQKLNELHTREVAYHRDVYVRPESGPPSRERISRELFRSLPTFEYRRPGIERAISRHAGAYAALLLFIPLMTWAARFSSKRPLAA
jgi:ABC-2 type transport system permease protein